MTHPRRTPGRNSSAGFTLIELLVVIAVIPILIALLLPREQDEREDHGRDNAGSHIQELKEGAEDFRSEHGEYPHDLKSLCEAFPDLCASLAANFANSGKADGYRFFLVHDPVSRLEAEPVCPGITGSESLFLELDSDERLPVRFEATPGAGERRQRMFANLLAEGSRRIAELLGLDPGAAQEMGDFVRSPEARDEVLDRLDADGNDQVSLTEVRDFDTTALEPELAGPLAAFLRVVDHEMKLSGQCDDEVAPVAVAKRTVTGDPRITFEELCGLTERFVTEQRVARSLCNHLKRAGRAEGREDLAARDAALEDYIREVKHEIHRSLTRSDGTTLILVTQGFFGVGEPG